MKNNNAAISKARLAIQNVYWRNLWEFNLKAEALANPTAAKRLAAAAQKSGLSPDHIINGHGVLRGLASGAKRHQINTPNVVLWEPCLENFTKRKWLIQPR